VESVTNCSEEQRLRDELIFAGPTLSEKAKRRTRPWVQILDSKYFEFRYFTYILNYFEFRGVQSIKTTPKYQNTHTTQNSKISAVSTPILTAKTAFFRIFQDLSQESTAIA
jgi:hypothetical protein